VGDTVYVRRGRDRQARLTPEEVETLDSVAQQREVARRPGRRARVIRVLPGGERVIVEGVNMMVKHTRPRGKMSQAARVQTGRVEQPGPISVANVMLVCPSCDRPTRVHRGKVEGRTARICNRCGEPADAPK
jgi:large subunit ribosomal protein L24